MIFKITGLETKYNIVESESTCLSITNKSLFRSVVTDIIENTEGSPNNRIVIEEQNKIVDFKKVYCITDYFRIEYNSKIIISLLYKKIEDNINLDYELKLQIVSVLNQLNLLIDESIDDFDVDIESDSDVKILALLKLFNYRIEKIDSKKTIDKLYTFINLLSVFNMYELIVFVNIYQYYTEEEVKELMKYLNYLKIKYLFIEGSFCEIMKKNKNCYLIDDDLNEYTI